MSARSRSVLLLLLVVLVSMLVAANGDCWNYVTGSRCDDEDYWERHGYPRCNDRCRQLGKDAGTCVTSTETCAYILSKDVKTCECYRIVPPDGRNVRRALRAR